MIIIAIATTIIMVIIMKTGTIGINNMTSDMAGLRMIEVIIIKIRKIRSILVIRIKMTLTS
ncbi:hypothetical protein D3C73_1163140 [compost metagenome]